MLKKLTQFNVRIKLPIPSVYSGIFAFPSMKPSIIASSFYGHDRLTTKKRSARHQNVFPNGPFVSGREISIEDLSMAFSSMIIRLAIAKY